MGNYNNFSAALAAGRKGEALAATLGKRQKYVNTLRRAELRLLSVAEC